MKAIFSVGLVKGQRAINADDGNTYVSQRAVAVLHPSVRVVGSGCDYFGNGSPYRGAVLCYPTWRKLLGEATRQMKTTGDYHHIFLENWSAADKQPEDGVLHINLHMGS
jgi:hypothetical protein